MDLLINIVFQLWGKQSNKEPQTQQNNLIPLEQKTPIQYLNCKRMIPFPKPSASHRDALICIKVEILAQKNSTAHCCGQVLENY